MQRRFQSFNQPVSPRRNVATRSFVKYVEGSGGASGLRDCTTPTSPTDGVQHHVVSQLRTALSDEETRAATEAWHGLLNATYAESLEQVLSVLNALQITLYEVTTEHVAHRVNLKGGRLALQEMYTLLEELKYIHAANAFESSFGQMFAEADPELTDAFAAIGGESDATGSVHYDQMQNVVGAFALDVDFRSISPSKDDEMDFAQFREMLRDDPRRTKFKGAKRENESLAMSDSALFLGRDEMRQSRVNSRTDSDTRFSFGRRSQTKVELYSKYSTTGRPPQLERSQRRSVSRSGGRRRRKGAALDEEGGSPGLIMSNRTFYSGLVPNVKRRTRTPNTPQNTLAGSKPPTPSLPPSRGDDGANAMLSGSTGPAKPLGSPSGQTPAQTFATDRMKTFAATLLANTAKREVQLNRDREAQLLAADPKNRHSATPGKGSPSARFRTNPRGLQPLRHVGSLPAMEGTTPQPNPATVSPQPQPPIPAMGRAVSFLSS